MYKKKEFNNLAKNYSKYQDSGSVGLMMDICHRGLEKIDYLKNFNNTSVVLEIGAGYTTPFLLEALVNNERVLDDGNLCEKYFSDYIYT